MFSNQPVHKSMSWVCGIQDMYCTRHVSYSHREPFTNKY